MFSSNCALYLECILLKSRTVLPCKVAGLLNNGTGDCVQVLGFRWGTLRVSMFLRVGKSCERLSFFGAPHAVTLGFLDSSHSLLQDHLWSFYQIYIFERPPSFPKTLIFLTDFPTFFFCVLWSYKIKLGIALSLGSGLLRVYNGLSLPFRGHAY